MCGVSPELFVQVTESPTEIVIALGVNRKFVALTPWDTANAGDPLKTSAKSATIMSPATLIFTRSSSNA